MKNIALIILTIISCSSINKSNYQDIDYVPNEETAIKIAEAVWHPIYGESIYQKKPFKASLLKDKVWRVEGTLAPNLLGGVPIIEIQKKDGKIIKVTHSK